MIGIVEKGILAKLNAASGVTSVVSTRIFATQPAMVAGLPYVLVTHNSGGSTNRSPRDDVDLLFSVKCVAVDASGSSGAAVAKAVSDATRAALHRATLTLDAPWNAYTCEQGDVFFYAENEDRVTYYHAGALYRVRAAE